MKLIKAFCTLPMISLVAMSAFAEDAAPPPHDGPLAACKQDVHTLCPDVQPGGDFGDGDEPRADHPRGARDGVRDEPPQALDALRLRPEAARLLPERECSRPS